MIDESHYRKEGKLGKLKRGMYSRMKQPMSRPRRGMESVNQAVQADWQHKQKQEKKFEYHEFSKTRAGGSALSVFAGAFMVLAVVGAVAYILFGAKTVTPGLVTIDIHGPNTITGGSILELHITVTNTNPSPLETADLIIKYPDGTRVPTNLLTDMSQQRLQLGDIEAGGVRTGTVRAAIFGSADERKDIDIELEYRARGGDALLVTRSAYSVGIISDAIDVSVASNKEVISGQSADFAITVKSNAGMLLRDVILQSRYPFGFDPNTFEPQPSRDNNYWELGDLSPGEERIIKIAGPFRGYDGDERTMHISVDLRNSVKKDVLGKNNQYTSQTSEKNTTLATLDHSFFVEKPFLGMKMNINDEAATKFTASEGSAMPIEILWKNNTKGTLSNIVVAATIYGSGVNPYTITASKGFYRSIDSVAIWDKVTTKGTLTSVGQGDDGRFLLRIVPRKKSQLKNITNPVINIELHAAGQRLSEVGVPETLQSTILDTIKLATNPAIKARLMYYENPFKSTGPLPPVVEKETKYGVMWELTNTTNKMEEVVVTASIPPYVIWDDIVSPVTESVVYDKIENTITWNVGELDAGVGIDGDSGKRIAFGIGFVPSASQLGSTPAVIKNIKLKGVDSFTGKDIELVIDDTTIQIQGEENFTDTDATVVGQKQ